MPLLAVINPPCHQVARTPRPRPPPRGPRGGAGRGEETGAGPGQMASGALALMLIQDVRYEFPPEARASGGAGGRRETSARAGDDQP